MLGGTPKGRFLTVWAMRMLQALGWSLPVGSSQTNNETG